MRSTKQIGKALKRARVERGATQGQVAQVLNVTQAMVAQIEEGRRAPGDKLLGLISRWIESGPVPGKAKRGPYKT